HVELAPVATVSQRPLAPGRGGRHGGRTTGDPESVAHRARCARRANLGGGQGTSARGPRTELRPASVPEPRWHDPDGVHQTRAVKNTADYYHRVFDATILESIQSDGRPRTDLDLNGLTIFIAPVSPEAAIPSAPTEPYVGLDHFGLRVENMDEAVAELKRRGA